MIEISKFKKIQVYGRAIFGKAASLAVQGQNGKEIKGTSIGLINLANEGVSGTISGTLSLTRDDSGKTQLLNNSGAGAFVTLPAPIAGWKQRFVVEVATAAAYVLLQADSANNMNGVIVSSAGAVTAAAADSDIVTFTSTAAAGDVVDIWSDGTGYYFTAHSRVAGGITGTQAS